MTLSTPTPKTPTMEPGNQTAGLAEAMNTRACALEPIVLSSRARERLRVLNQILESVVPRETSDDSRPAQENVTVSNG